LISLALHVGLIAATYLTWHRMLAPPEETHAVPVDLVTIARETNVAAQAPPPEKITIPKPTIDQPALPEFARAEPAPEPPIPKIKIQPDKSDKDDQADKKPTNQDFAALLNKLTAAQTPPKNAKTGTRTVEGVGNANLMTASLVDALRSQIARCWNVGAISGGPNAADSVVDFQVQLNRNGSVASLALASGSVARAAVNPYTRAAAEAASRAIYECQPYRLPPDRYSEWSEINPFHFDPRQMMNQ
jgi:colicin import membrane protein